MAKVIAVFGGTKGIGFGIAKKFLYDGFKVSVLSRSDEHVRKAEQLLKDGLSGDVMTEIGKSILGLSCDVNDENKILESFKIIEKKLGPVDTVINTAGINEDSLLIKTSMSSIHKTISTNLIGSILTSKIALKFLLPRKNGCIINVGSIIGVKGNVGQCVYSASKSGLIGFTKSLAKEVADRGIRVNLLLPGFIETNMTADLKNRQKLEDLTILKRLGKQEDVANIAKFLYESTYITGTVVYIDGGLHLNL